jgi:hypothetical protein
MGSPSLGNHLLRASVVRRILHIIKGFGMIASRKILGNSLKQESMNTKRRTCLWLVIPRREKDRVLRKEERRT